MLTTATFILDGRDWRGGIGRFASETVAYLPPHELLRSRVRPTSPLAPFDLAARLRPATLPFFSHGYLPPARSPVPVIVTVHDLMYLPGHTARSRPRAVYMAAMRPLLRRCAAIVTMSHAARDDVHEWLGDGVRIVAVGGGVSPVFFPGEGAAAAGGPVVLYVGSRAPNKNIQAVLRAFARSAHAAELVVTGTRQEWAASLRVAGVEPGEQIRYLGSVGETELAEAYRQATVLLMPSIEEGYGLPALEAMASGVPVVYGRDAAMCEVVAGAGLSVDPHDSDALAAAVDAVIVDADLAARLTAEGLRRAAERTWPAVADRIAALIESVSP